MPQINFLLADASPCPTPLDGQSITCTYVILQPSDPNPDSVVWMDGINQLCIRSMEVTAPLYLLVWTIGMFRRYILCRI